MIPGDPTGAAVWSELDEYLRRQRRHENGIVLPVSACCIDSGHWTGISKLPRNDFGSVLVRRPQHIWVAGYYGRYALTTDGGAQLRRPGVARRPP